MYIYVYDSPMNVYKVNDAYKYSRKHYALYLCIIHDFTYTHTHTHTIQSLQHMNVQIAMVSAWYQTTMDPTNLQIKRYSLTVNDRWNSSLWQHSHWERRKIFRREFHFECVYTVGWVHNLLKQAAVL